MHRASPLVALVVLVVVVSPAPLATGSIGVDTAGVPGPPGDRSTGIAPPPDPIAVPEEAYDYDDSYGSDAGVSPPAGGSGKGTTADGDGAVDVVFELDPGAPVPQRIRPAVERIRVEDGDRLAYVSATLAVVDRLAEHPDVRSARVRRRPPASVVEPTGQTTADLVGVDDVHRANVTGRNVTVGVIDADFRITHPDLAPNVGAYRRFDDGGGWRHGTAVAAVVADVAPGASIHMAAVGSRVTPGEYRAAVEWLLASGADVIVDAGSYHAQPGDGTGPIARTAARAAERAVVVTSVGNHAGGYWRGNHTGEAGDWVAFDGLEGNPLDGSAGAIRATLRWDDPAANYGLYLFREQPGRDAVVDSAVASASGRNVSLAITVPDGDYYLAIRDAGLAPNATAANATRTTTLELVVNRDLRHSVRARPSAPATAPGVLAVGAVRDGEPRPFSVAGADLVAPDRVPTDRHLGVDGGTSISAPYVAGAAALTVAANPDLSPGEVRSRLLAGARDLGPDGPDPRTGHGIVDADVAIHPPTVWPVRPGGNVTVGRTETRG